jgi:hypothetical protein
MTHIHADFDALDEEGRYWLPSATGADAMPGQRAVPTDGEVVIEATLAFDDDRNVWLGVPDRSTLCALPTLPELPTGL